MTTRPWAAVAIIACAAAAQIALATAPATADGSLDRARAEGVTFAFSNEPPFAYLGEDGNPAGVNGEAIVTILKKIGVTEIRPVMTEWASLVPGLSAGRFDLATSMFILPTRCEAVAFAEPLSKTGGAMLVKKGNPKDIHSYEDVANDPDVRVAVMAGAAEGRYLAKAGVPEDRIVALQDPGAMLAAVVSGRADAATLTPGSVRSMAEKSADKVEAADPFITPEWATSYSSVPFRKEDVALREAFSAALKDFLGSAEWQALYQKYDMMDPNPLPGDMTTAEQCNKAD